MTLPADKKAFRKLALDKRDSLPEAERMKASERIQNKLSSLPAFHTSRVILGYMNFKSEVVCTEILRLILSLGKKVVIPLSVPETRTLLLSEIRDLDRDLERDFYGILVPKKEIFRQISPKEIDFVIVPGVAFSEDRFRMGYGAGYYDRFLADLRPDAVCAGLAFEAQVFTKIPTESHDKQMDFVITERRILGLSDQRSQTGTPLPPR